MCVCVHLFRFYLSLIFSLFLSFYFFHSAWQSRGPLRLSSRVRRGRAEGESTYPPRIRDRLSPHHPLAKEKVRIGALSERFSGVSSRSRYVSTLIYGTPVALGVFRSWLVAFPGARAFAHQVDVLRVPHPVGADQPYLSQSTFHYYFFFNNVAHRKRDARRMLNSISFMNYLFILLIKHVETSIWFNSYLAPFRFPRQTARVATTTPTLGKFYWSPTPTSILAVILPGVLLATRRCCKK